MSLERKKGLPEFPKGSLEGFPILHDRLGIGTVGGRSVCNGVPKLPHHQKLAFTRCVQALLGTVPVNKVQRIFPLFFYIPMRWPTHKKR